MIELVVDANVAIDWFVPTPEGRAHSEPLILRAIDGEVLLHVPMHFDVEVVGQLVKHHRRDPVAFPKTWFRDSMAILDSLPIHTHAIGTQFKQLGDLCLAYRLTAYDVPYLELARLLECPLATRDKGLKSACTAWHVARWTA